VTVGEAVPILGVNLIEVSPEVVAENIEVTITRRDSIEEIRDDSIYRRLLPEEVYLGTQSSACVAAPGVAHLPPPSDLPPILGGPCFSLFGVQKGTITDDVSRRLWLDFEFLLEKKDGETIGGLCYGGFPFLPSYVNEHGESSANFGLPRELRLTWQGFETEGFPDSENTFSSQESSSHSGVHILATGPIRAERLRLRVADLPRLLARVAPRDGSFRVEERWGFALTYLYAFRYRESTRYRPRVPGGLLAAVQVPPSFRQSYFAPVPEPPPPPDLEGIAPSGPPAPGEPYRGASADLVARTSPHSYLPFSAGALFGQRREYTLGGGTGEEFFASGRLKPGQQVRIYLEQAEEQLELLQSAHVHVGPRVASKRQR
jgi:hypothetical protein